MYLDLVNNMGDGPEAQQLRAMQAAGMRLPGVVCLLAFRPEWTASLNQFCHQVMRGNGKLPTWQRELVAALTSKYNHCVF
jgi:hypothetical protein